MNLSDALILLLQTGFVLMAALLVGLLARRVPAVRQGGYRLAIVAVAVLALGQPWLRERPTPVVPVRWSVPSTSVTVTPTETDDKPAPPKAPTAIAVSPPPAAPEPLDPIALWPWLWFGGVALLSAHLAAGYVCLARVRRGCRTVKAEEVWRILGKVAQQAGAPVPLAVEGEAVGNPFVAGVRRPTLYLPLGWAESMDSESLEAVLRHEVAHLANRDLLWSLLHRLLTIALWPQPLLWLLRRPMNAAAEELCDGHVLAAGIPGSRYAECLLNLRESLRAQPCPSLGIGAISSRSALGKRVEAILDAKRSRMIRLSRPSIVALRIGALALAASAALVFARPSASQGPIQDNWITAPYQGTIQVVGPDGKPRKIKGAWLLMNTAEDRTGVVEFQPGTTEILLPERKLPNFVLGKLIVSAEGCGTAYVNLWPAPEKLTEIVLPVETAVEGKFFLPNGSPAIGKRVRIDLFVAKAGPDDFRFLDTKGLPRGAFETQTGVDGSFRLTGLPPNTSVGYSVWDKAFASLGMEERIGTGKTGTVQAKPITLKPAAMFSGRVMRDGKPVVGLRIAAQSNHSGGGIVDGWSQAFTDKDGRYTIGRLRPGLYNVIADTSQEFADATAVAHEAVSVKVGETRESLDFELIPGVLVEGRVTDPAGKSVAGAYVGVYGPSHPNSSAWVQGMQSGADGSFRFHVPPGKQYVYIGDSRYDAKAQNVQAEEGAVTTVNFQVAQAAPTPPPAMAEAVSAKEISEPFEKSKLKGPDVAVASFGSGKPFYGPAKLKNGTTVRLAYVQDDEGGSHTVWNPDGGPADPKYTKESLNMKGFARGEKEGVRRMFLRVEVEGAARGDYYCLIDVPHNSDWNVWQTYGDDEDRSMDLASFQASSKLQTTDMKFGVAAGPFKTIAVGKPGEGELNAKAYSGRTTGSATLVGDASVSITVRIPRGLDGKDLRLDAYDKSGRKLELASWENENMREKGSGLPVRNFGFSGGTAEDVARVELTARDYEWVVFTGIEMHPKPRP